MYRDDLEAAQARVDALEREARQHKERADHAEREANELRTKNSQLAWDAAAAQARHDEQQLELQSVRSAQRRPREEPGWTPARMRRSKIGWALMLAGGVTMYVAARLEVGAGFTAGMVILILGGILA